MLEIFRYLNRGGVDISSIKLSPLYKIKCISFFLPLTFVVRTPPFLLLATVAKCCDTSSSMIVATVIFVIVVPNMVSVAIFVENRRFLKFFRV